MGTRREAEKRALEIVRVLMEGTPKVAQYNLEWAIQEAQRKFDPRIVELIARVLSAADAEVGLAETKADLGSRLLEVVEKGLDGVHEKHYDFLNRYAEDPIVFESAEHAVRAVSAHMEAIPQQYLAVYDRLSAYSLFRFLTGGEDGLPVARSPDDMGIPFAPPGNPPRLKD